MRFGTIDGRAVLVTDQSWIDIEKASDRRFPSDALGVLERWEDFRTWVTETDGGRGAPLDPARLGPPVPNPRQVFALAVNYTDHAAEANREPPEHPYVFTKFPSCITGPYDPVILPSNRVDWEAELVVVIGKTASHVNAEQAWTYVAGLTVGQDISERRIQFRKPLPHLSIAKSFPTFGPTGPWLSTTDEFADPDDLALSCQVNGESMQSSRTSQMIFSVTELVSSLSSMVTLLPGDLIFTGTPAGVGSARDPRRYLAPGDVITTEIEGIGTLRNLCAEKPA